MLSSVIFPLFTAMPTVPRTVPTQSRCPIKPCGRKEWRALLSPLGKEGIQQPLFGPRILYLFFYHVSAVMAGEMASVGGWVGAGEGDY